MYAEYNNNPQNKRVGDCVIRAIAKALGKEWNEIYIDLSMEGFKQADSFQSMAVWGRYLKEHGWQQMLVPDTCPACYTVKQFCNDNPQGYFILVGTCFPSSTILELDGSSSRLLTATIRSGSTRPSIISSVLMDMVNILLGLAGMVTVVP